YLHPVFRRSAIDVIPVIHWAQVPLLVTIERAEEGELHDDVPLFSFLYEVAEPGKIGFVPLREVELVAAVGVSIDVTSFPWADKAIGLRCERILLDAERARRLYVGARHRTREVQAVCG